MAIALEDKPNVDPPSALYPNGNIRDNPGDGSGTPVNALVHADFHQFFARLLVEGVVTPNGQPENAYTGFQYIEAFKRLAGDIPVPYITTGITYPGSVASAGANLGYKKTIRNTIRFAGILTGPGSSSSFNASIMSLPLGMRPSRNQKSVVAISQAAGSDFAATILFDTSGGITLNAVPSGVVLSGGTLSIYLDGLEFDL